MNIERDRTLQEVLTNGDYDDLTNLGKQVQDNMDAGRWVIGDIALRIKKDYGKDAIGEFAKDIQVAKKTVMSYRAMSAFWTPEWRAYIHERFSFSWSILRVAKRGGEIEEAIDFLNHCANEGITTVDDCARVAGERWGTPTRPEKLTRGDFLCSRNEGGTITLIAHDMPPETTKDLQLGITYRVDIYSITDNEEGNADD